MKSIEGVASEILDLVSFRLSETEREGHDTFINGADREAVGILRQWMIGVRECMFSQNGQVILKNGAPMTHEEIVSELNSLQTSKKMLWQDLLKNDKEAADFFKDAKKVFGEAPEMIAYTRRGDRGK